jgi:hypothetical protein
MAKTILIDEIHLGFFVPNGLPDPECDTIRAVLNDAIFLRRLRRAVRDAVCLQPALRRLRFTITR